LPARLHQGGHRGLSFRMSRAGVLATLRARAGTRPGGRGFTP
jgi:hypothetical protein